MPPESWSGNWLAASSKPTSFSTSFARARRSGFPMPLTSSPKATLSITRRCASRPKCWNTIETELRRSSRSSAAPAAETSWPAISICPAVGSISRIRVRTRVDLPEPDRPMTTNTSPGQTSIETSRTATTQSVFSRSSPRGRYASGEPTRRSGCGPKTFQIPEARMTGGLVQSIRCCVGARGVSAVSVMRAPLIYHPRSRLSIQGAARSGYGTSMRVSFRTVSTENAMITIAAPTTPVLAPSERSSVSSRSPSSPLMSDRVNCRMLRKRMPSR